MFKAFSAAALVATVATSAQAAVVTQYNTAGGTASLAPFAADASVSADNLVAGSGLTTLNFSTFNHSGWDTASTSFGDAVAANDFITWGFDVTSPVTIDLTTMDTRWDRSGSGPDDFEIQVSVNGAPGITVLTHDYQDSGSGVNFLGVDLSAIPTLGLGDSVVFTLAAFNSESSGGTFDLETITFPGGNDSIVINGDIVVPEPASMALLAAGLGVIGLRRRSA